MLVYIILSILLVIIISIIVFVQITFKKNNPHVCNLSKHDLSTYPGTIEFHKEEGTVPYLIKRKEDGTISDDPFKIMLVADMHNSTSECEFTLTVLSRFIDLEKPDLVIMLGDNVTSHEDTVVQDKLIKFFEDRKLYYGFVLGNHDSEAKVSNEIRRKEKVKLLSQEEKNEIIIRGRKWAFDTMANSKYCVSYDDLSGILHGSGNSVVNIKDSNGVKQSLFFFDSGDYVWDRKRKAIGTEKRCYDYLRLNQLDWFNDKLNEITKNNNGVKPKSCCFFHIALPEHETAWVEANKKNGNAKLIFGANYEKCCSSDLDDGAFDTFKASNSAQLLVVGHDHKNDSLIEYQGIKMMFSQGLQFDGAYNRRKRATLSFKLLNKLGGKYSIYNEGVSIIQVKKDGDLDIYPRYAEKEGFYKGLEKYYDKAFFKNFNSNGKGLSYVSTDIVNYVKRLATEVNLGKYDRIGNLFIKSKVKQYRIKNFGYLFLMETKSILNSFKSTSLVFTPSSGLDVPLLNVYLFNSKKKNLGFIEFYDLTKKKLGHNDFNKLPEKYNDVENYIKDDDLYKNKRAPYSLIKGGVNTTKAQIDTMAINAIKTYVLVAQESTIELDNLIELKEFKDQFIKDGNELTTLVQSILNKKSEVFLNDIVMNTEYRNE